MTGWVDKTYLYWLAGIHSRYYGREEEEEEGIDGLDKSLQEYHW